MQIRNYAKQLPDDNAGDNNNNDYAVTPAEIAVCVTQMIVFSVVLCFQWTGAKLKTLLLQ